MNWVFNFNERAKNVLRFVNNKGEVIDWRIRGKNNIENIAVGQEGVVKTGRKIRDKEPGYHAVVKVTDLHYDENGVMDYVTIENTRVLDEKNNVIFNLIEDELIETYSERTKHWQLPVFPMEEEVLERILNQ